MTRVIYNRIPKAGSSTLITLFAALSARNNFTIKSDNHYFPPYQALRETLLNMPDDSIYINHCNYMDSLPADGNFVWINVAREPVDRDQSYYYYEVSAIRGHLASEAFKNRKRDPCGCAYLEYDECIRFLASHHNCTDHLVRKDNARMYFSLPTNQSVAEHDMYSQVQHGFTAQQAFEVVRSKYLFVGLTEELELTIMALERLLPRFFAGALDLYHTDAAATATAAEIAAAKTNSSTAAATTSKRPASATLTSASGSSSGNSAIRKNKTSMTNSLTHTALNGAISTAARQEVEKHNPGEVALYRNITRLFWWKVSQILPEQVSFQ
jgi:hypothetical protein